MSLVWCYKVRQSKRTPVEVQVEGKDIEQLHAHLSMYLHVLKCNVMLQWVLYASQTSEMKCTVVFCFLYSTEEESITKNVIHNTLPSIYKLTQNDLTGGTEDDFKW